MQKRKKTTEREMVWQSMYQGCSIDIPLSQPSGQGCHTGNHCDVKPNYPDDWV